jgi:hypothetical protein
MLVYVQVEGATYAELQYVNLSGANSSIKRRQ